MIDPGLPMRVVAEVCIPDKEGGEICATAREPLEGTGRAWVDCRVRARKLAEAAQDGEEGVVICERCETNVVVQHGGDTLLGADCRSETSEDREMERNGLSRRTEREILTEIEPQTLYAVARSPLARRIVQTPDETNSEVVLRIE